MSAPLTKLTSLMATNEAKPAPPAVPTIRSTRRRMRYDAAFQLLCLAATVLAVLILVVLLLSILTQGLGGLNLDFLKQGNSSSPETAGVRVSLVGSIMAVAICGLVAIPLGVGTAILIEEFRPKGDGVGTPISIGASLAFLALTALAIFVGYKLKIASGGLIVLGIYCFFCFSICFAVYALIIRTLGHGSILVAVHGIIETNIRNLAGVPSIVYGILGASAFAMMFGLFGPMGQSNFAIGQDWYDLYQSEDKVSYYVPRRGPERTDGDIVLASAGLTYYKSKDLKEVAGDFTWITEEDVEPIRKRIQEDMPTFTDALKDAVKDTKTGGKPAIDQAKAQEIADIAIAAGTWESDPALFRDELITAIAAIDGTGFKDRITAQNRAIAIGVDAEFAYRVPNTMMTGRKPVRVDRKAWYYFSLPFGRGVLTGGLTLMLVILPIVIVASQEALRAVPGSYRQGALALGATKWQALSKTALPAAVPGICTGTILAISRAIGEAAPLLAIGGVGYVTSTPGNLMDRFSALPLNIYKWSGEPNRDFQTVAAAGIIVLLVVLLSFNALAIYIRHRASKHQ